MVNLKNTFYSLSAFTFVVLSTVCSAETQIGLNSFEIDQDTEIEITADSMTFSSATNITEFFDRVVVIYGQLKLTAKSLKISQTNQSGLTKNIEFDASGNITLDGNLKVASGKGIDFSATGDGDGTDSSELLDDYEEGTWTAVVAGVDGGTRTMGSNNKAYYTKVGRSVTVTGTLHVNGSETLSGFVKITGIPYASDNASNHRAAGSVSANQLFNTGASGTRLGIGIDPGNAFIFVLKVNDSTPNYAHIVNADVGANHNLYGFTLTYNA